MLIASDIARIEAHWAGPNRIGNSPEVDRCLEDIDILLAEVKRLRKGLIEGTGWWKNDVLIDMEGWAMDLLGIERTAFVREMPKGENDKV